MQKRMVGRLDTPCVVIDRARLLRNTQRMSERATRLGVHLRPHVKTHKCLEAARHQVAGHFGGITVSTLAEAEHFAAGGFDDITYAVPLAPGRARRAVDFSLRCPQFQVLVDHGDSVDALVAEARRMGASIGVLVKVDCGYHRAGLLPEDPELVALARRIHEAQSLRFMGVLAHGGHSYDCVGVDAIKRVAEEERRETVRAAETLRAAGLPVEVVSVGSTPTASVVEDLTGVTELRPGNYAVFDMFQASIGSCDTDDVALSVLSEVIGVYPERGMLLIDAGALAMSKDPGATHARGSDGFGLVCSLDGTPILGLSLVGLSQEHGKLVASPEFRGDLPGIGSRVRILPNHSCLVAALHTPLYVLEGDRVVDEWVPARGW
jgi:D-serine deaminase-like pyridoxal phosphate-dependent protein